MNKTVNDSLTARLRHLLGEPVVFLKIRYGEKAPKWKGWQQSRHDGFGADYYASLDTGQHNIGVLLGAPSGGLCSIDIDNDEDVEPFLERNPHLRRTLRTRGRRGCNFWVRIKGDYPKLTKLKRPDGSPWGEWRADGGQTVIYGRHPDGMDYEILMPKPVVTLAFEEIDWSYARNPSQGEAFSQLNESGKPLSRLNDLGQLNSQLWISEKTGNQSSDSAEVCSQQQSSSEIACQHDGSNKTASQLSNSEQIGCQQPTSGQLLSQLKASGEIESQLSTSDSNVPHVENISEEALYHNLVREHGEPFSISEKGSVSLNHPFLVGRYAVEHLVLHEATEREFYEYAEPRGLWVRQSVDSIKQHFSSDLKRFADAANVERIHYMRTNGLLTSLADLLRGEVERRGVFEGRRQFVHLGNGMLHLDCTPPELRPFSPDYHSRNQCPIPLVEGAQCPQFLDVLLRPALDDEDICLLQRWAGSLLLGGNVAQRILLLTGTPGGGKSTLLEILEAIVGDENIHELRTEHLHERFELQFFIGKTLLTGKDVPGNFLQSKGASMLKKLVGNDFISPERKGQNDIFKLRGNFDIAITANSRLHVRLDGDAGAWQRRLMVIRYERAKPKERISNLGQKLLEEEGSGILNWMLQGAVDHLVELAAHGDFMLTPRQSQRVDDLLAESDSVRAFVRSCVEPCVMGDVSTDELVRAYLDFCERKEWNAQSQRQVERQLPDLMMECLGVTRRNDLVRGERKQRGYGGVTIHEKA